MPVSNWGDTTADRAATTAQRIAEQPAVIAVTRRGAALAAQTVRVDLQAASSRQERGQGNAQASVLRVLVTGYKGHATLDDTDLRVGDRFTVSGDASGVVYEVVAVAPGPAWRLEALAEARV